MELLALLLLLICRTGFTFSLPSGPNGIPGIQIPGIPNNDMNTLPNGFPKGLFSGLPNAAMSVPASFMSGGVQVVPKVEGNSTKQNNTCCFGTTCLSPCPFDPRMAMPMPMPVPAPPAAPILVPARTYYEPVVHNHPPLHKIRNIIRQDRERKRKRRRYYESSDTDCSGTDTDSYSDSSLEDSRIDYYDDVIHVKV